MNELHFVRAPIAKAPIRALLVAALAILSACGGGGQGTVPSPPAAPPGAGPVAAVAAPVTATVPAETRLGAPTPGASLAASAAATPAPGGAAQMSASPLPSAASPGAGAFVFTANNSAVFGALEQHANARSRIGLDIYNADQRLAAVVPREHTVQLADSIANVQSDAFKTNAAATILYDIEHWPATPASEQAAPVPSIAAAARAAHAAGKKFGVASDGLFLGIRPWACSYDIAQGIIPGVDWSHVDDVNLQVQMLASDRRCTGVTQYGAFVQSAVAIMRAQNPTIHISAQVSLRDSTPARAIAAIATVRGIVDEIYVAYPPANCPNCTPGALDAVLTAL